jgi:nucleotide-binding universal stress UspA family protein
MKTLLVQLSGTERDDSVLAGASLVGRYFGAHLSCLRIEPDPIATLGLISGYDMAPASVIGEAMHAAKLDNRKKTQRAEERFLRFCRAADIRISNEPRVSTGMSAAWSHEEGDEVEVLIGRAKFHDLVVLAGGSRKKQDLTTVPVGSIVLAAGRPVLLVPDATAAEHLGTVALAWKDTPQAARAVTAAMPLLEKAERVLVLGVPENQGRAQATADGLGEVVRQLQWHGIAAEARVLPRDGTGTAEALLNAARAAGAGLFVMGAYGHSRLREIVFGGVTEHVLNGVDLPVLLAH